MEKQGPGKPNFGTPKIPGGPVVLGHRGSGAGPGENTLAAFVQAVADGADGVELDARRTVDGALVVHHDPVIPGAGAVSELTVRDLPAQVPLLEAALDALGAGLVNIEVKNLPHEAGFDPDELTARQVAALVSERRSWLSVVVSAFTPASLRAALEAAPEAVTGWLLPGGLDVAALVEPAARAGYAALHPHHSLVAGDWVAAAHHRGLSVNTWTVNEAADLRRVVAAGVDAVITDSVATARSVLASDP